jgi:hypothetical protein
MISGTSLRVRFEYQATIPKEAYVDNGHAKVMLQLKTTPGSGVGELVFVSGVVIERKRVFVGAVEGDQHGDDERKNGAKTSGDSLSRNSSVKPAGQSTPKENDVSKPLGADSEKRNSTGMKLFSEQDWESLMRINSSTTTLDTLLNSKGTSSDTNVWAGKDGLSSAQEAASLISSISSISDTKTMTDALHPTPPTTPPPVDNEARNSLETSFTGIIEDVALAEELIYSLPGAKDVHISTPRTAFPSMIPTPSSALSTAKEDPPYSPPRSRSSSLTRLTNFPARSSLQSIQSALSNSSLNSALTRSKPNSEYQQQQKPEPPRLAIAKKPSWKPTTSAMPTDELVIMSFNIPIPHTALEDVDLDELKEVKITHRFKFRIVYAPVCEDVGEVNLEFKEDWIEIPVVMAMGACA